MKTMEIKPDNLFDYLEDLTQVSSSSWDIKYFLERPAHVAFYEKMKSFTAVELETARPIEKMGWRSKQSLYDAILAKKHMLAFGALMEKGAFLDKLTVSSKWLHAHYSTKGDIPYYICNMLFNMQEYARHRSRDEKRSELYFFLNQMSYNLEILAPDDKAAITQYILSEAKKNKANAQCIVEFVFENMTQLAAPSGNAVELTNFVANILGDISKEESLFNKYKMRLTKLLPASDKSSESFFISSLYLPGISKMIELGFRVDEHKYRFNGKNLMAAIMASHRVDIFNTFLPTITDPRVMVRDKDESAQVLRAITDKSIDCPYFKLKVSNPNDLYNAFNAKIVEYEKNVLNKKVAPASSVNEGDKMHLNKI